jgi:hypothetical protein
MDEEERMHQPDDQNPRTKDCPRCGGRALYWRNAIVPGDPLVPRGSSRAIAHPQPAWTCISCGHMDPHERRARANDDAPRPVWRV